MPANHVQETVCIREHRVEVGVERQVVARHHSELSLVGGVETIEEWEIDGRDVEGALVDKVLDGAVKDIGDAGGTEEPITPVR